MSGAPMTKKNRALIVPLSSKTLSVSNSVAGVSLTKIFQPFFHFHVRSGPKLSTSSKKIDLNTSFTLDETTKSRRKHKSEKLRFRYNITARIQRGRGLRACGRASEQANQMVQEMARVLGEKREKKGASMNALSAASYLDRAALHRAEKGERIPSLAFWIDWADTLGTSLEAVVTEARKRVGKTKGQPPERRPF